MMRFHTRSELIQYARDGAPSSACKRAMLHDVVLLGKFVPIPPFDSPGGWMMVVHSKHGREWILAVVLASQPGQPPTVREADVFPWHCWAGDPAKASRTLDNGDLPGYNAMMMKGDTDDTTTEAPGDRDPGGRS